MTYVIDHDDLWPRDEEHRFRLYAVVPGLEGQPPAKMEVLAAAATAGGVGNAIFTIHEELKQEGSRLADLGYVGVLDVLEHDWIVLPFTRRSAA